MLKNEIDFENNNSIHNFILLKKIGSIMINGCLNFWSQEILMR